MSINSDREDEVARIVAAWRRERPDLDVRPLEVLSRVTRLAKRLDQIRKAVFARHGLETWAFDVLAALRRSGQPYRLSPGQLVIETMVTSGTMTNRVDRLSALGHVERHPDPNDRRGVLVQLTAQGAQTVDGALTDLLEAERDLLAGLSDEDAEHLAELLRHLVCDIGLRDTP